MFSASARKDVVLKSLVYKLLLQTEPGTEIRSMCGVEERVRSVILVLCVSS